MQPETGLDRAGPTPGLQALQTVSERGAEQARDFALSNSAQLGRQRQRVTELLEVPLRPGGRDALQQLQRILLCGCAPAVPAEIHLAQGQPRLDREIKRVFIEVGLQILHGRGRQRSDVFGQQLELLPQAAPHNNVVLVQAHGLALAVSDFLPHIVLQQALELLRRGRPLPGAAERVEQIFLLSFADEDLSRLAAFAGELIVDHKDECTKQ